MFSGKFFTTSEQHVELRTSREEKDRIDFDKFKDWLKEHNPFDQTKPELYSISTGVVATSMINCDRAEAIGSDRLKEMIGQNFADVEMNYKMKVKPLGFTMKSMKLNGQEIIINPHQLFHRMLTVMPTLDRLRDSFNFELASYPLSMFDENGIRKSESISMFRYFDKIQDSNNNVFTHDNSLFFISGECLLQKVLWNTTQTFGEIIDEYVHYILHYYGRNNVNIIFDGTSDRLWQAKTTTSTKVLFEPHIRATIKQSEFLSNDTNKLRMVNYLMKKLSDENIQTFQAENTSKYLICKLAVSAAKNCSKNVVVVGEELDLLVLLIDQTVTENVFMLRPGKKSDQTSYVASIQRKLGTATEIILPIHVFSGCQSTSAFFQKGKISFLKKVMSNDSISKCLNIFNTPNADVGKLYEAGQKLLLCVYGAKAQAANINLFRYELFEKINRYLQRFYSYPLKSVYLSVYQNVCQDRF